MKTTNNPFQFEQSNTTSTESRRLDFTPALIDRSNQRAQELMLNVGKNPDLYELANKAIDGGNPQDLVDLINAVFDEDTIKADSEILAGCDDNQLGRLLESRRSDRSKAKKKDPRSNVQVCKTYISSMYAELLVRKFWNKPYTGQVGSAEIDIDALKDDQEAISRKVKSLQSKKSRLGKIAQYDTAAKQELEETEAEIARLNALRPSVRVSAKTVIKDIGLDQLRAALKEIDPSSLPAAEQQKLTDLMAKLG